MRPDVNHFLRPRGRVVPAEDIPNRLRELASEATPPYDWQEFRRRSHEHAARKGRHVKWWPHAAAAAGLAGVVTAMALLGNGSNADYGLVTETAQSLGGSVATSRPVSGEPGVPATRDWLARQPAEPVVVRVGSHITVTNLEDRIAFYDDVLMNERLQGANAEQVKVLQQERARLVSTLAQVRYAEALMAGGS
jgi:hypothetical protein